MRPGKGCTSCRDRHLKCVTEPGQTVCTRCYEADRECNFAPKFRFRQVASVDAATNNGTKQELNYDPSQVWVSTKKNFNWVLEDGTGLEYGIPEEEDLPEREPEPAPHPHVRNGNSPARNDPTAATSTSTGKIARSSATIAALLNAPESPVERRPSALAVQLREISSPASLDELCKRHEEASAQTPSLTAPFPVGSTTAASPASLATPDILPRANLSRREAYLIQHFINKIGPWMDVCDLACHFTHELPRRAMRKPMVLYAILALSSRHLSTMNQQPPPDEAAFYHGQCLRLVIEQLSGPESLYDDNLFSTLVCMRVFEEVISNSEELLHLQGTDRLLRTLPTFCHSGGLGEAACWQALRQDIYVSMTKSVPPSFYLENFDQSSVFTFRDDAACANIVVLLFAKILRMAHKQEEQEGDMATWNRLSADVDAWNDRRLRLFQPIYYEDFDLAENRPFPIINMISPPQVAALQYYHACKTYLLLHKPEEESLSGFHAAKRRRTLERDVTFHLAAIVGLAQSNPFVENANFTAHHMLRICGYCMTHRLQRQQVLEFLEHVEKVMGWSTQHTVSMLRGQWSDLDCPND